MTRKFREPEDKIDMKNKSTAEHIVEYMEAKETDKLIKKTDKIIAKAQEFFVYQKEMRK